MVYNQELKREIPEGWEVRTISQFIGNNKGGDWGKEQEEGMKREGGGEEREKEKEAKKARDEIVNATAEKLAAMAPTQAAITERVIREVKTNTVYRDCVLPDDGLRLVNAARAGSAGKSDNSLPATSTNSVER